MIGAQISSVFAAESLTDSFENLKSHTGYEGKNAIIDATIDSDFAIEKQTVNGILSLRRFNDIFGVQYSGVTDCVIKKDIDPLPTTGKVTVTLKSQTNRGNGVRIKLKSGDETVADIVIGDLEGKTRINSMPVGSVRGSGWGWHNSSEYWCTEEITLNYDTNRISWYFKRVGMQNWASYLYNDDGEKIGELTADEVQSSKTDFTYYGLPITFSGEEAKGAIDSIELSPCNSSDPESDVYRDVLYLSDKYPDRYWNIDKVSISVDGTQILNDDFTEDKPLYEYGWRFANKTGYAGFANGNIVFVKEGDNDFNPFLYIPVENVDIDGNYSVKFTAGAVRNSEDGEEIAQANIKAGLYDSESGETIFISGYDITGDDEFVITGNTKDGKAEFLKRDGDELVLVDELKSGEAYKFDTIVLGAASIETPSDGEYTVLKFSDMTLFTDDFIMKFSSTDGEESVRTDADVRITFSDDVNKFSVSGIRTYLGDEEVKSEVSVSEEDPKTVIIKYPFGLLYNVGYKIKAESSVKNSVGINLIPGTVAFRTESLPVSITEKAVSSVTKQATVKIKNDTGFEQNYAVIVAAYDSKGLLTEVTCENIRAADGENEYTVSLGDKSADASSFKTMIWQSMIDLTPIY